LGATGAILNKATRLNAIADTLPKSRTEATKIGSPHFFTGKPCRNKHLAVRKTADNRCVDCRVESRAVGHIKNREKSLIYSKSYYKNNKEHHRELAIRWAKENVLKMRESRDKYRKNHPEKWAEYKRRYCFKYPERIKAMEKRWRESDAGRASGALKAYKRRMVIKDVDADKISHRPLAVRDGYICHICKKKVTPKNWSIDIAHKRCNSIMGAGRISAQLPLIARPF
jgi:hypothetical protein